MFRKELLLSTRNLMRMPVAAADPATAGTPAAAPGDIQLGFLPHIDVLLEDRYLLGTSLTCQEVRGRAAVALPSSCSHGQGRAKRTWIRCVDLPSRGEKEAGGRSAQDAGLR